MADPADAGHGPGRRRWQQWRASPGGARLAGLNLLDGRGTRPMRPLPCSTPWTRSTQALGTPCPVRLEIYNVLGQRVRTLVEQFQAGGSYQVHWDARDQEGSEVSAGVYLASLNYPGGVQTRRLLFLR